MVVFICFGFSDVCCSDMDSLAIVDNYHAAYRTNSVEYMKGKILENEDPINDVVETMLSHTLLTIASAAALREKTKTAK